MVRLAMAAALMAAIAAPASAAASFSRWAAVVISGDDHASHTDELTATFDNARRDVSAALEQRGFEADNLAQFSVRPDRWRRDEVRRADLPAIAATLKRLAAKAPDGCLIYLTSHGSPDGAVLGDDLVSPTAMARLVAQACPGRPVVAVISACFSGVFTRALAGPDRLVMTAARRDRSSFGCGESDTYPYFDDCVLRSLPAASGFVALIPKVRACVASREKAEDVAPPSKPQAFVGGKLRRALPLFTPDQRSPQRIGIAR